MDIEGLGDVAVHQLVEKKLIKDLADVYGLTKRELLQLELFADKKAENLLAPWKKARHAAVPCTLGLGIRHVGEKVAFVLAQKFQAIDALADSTEDSLRIIPEVGPIIAQALVSYFRLPTTQTILRKLKRAGLR